MVSKRSFLRAVIGSVMAVIGFVAVLPGAAQAAYLCPEGILCLYQNLNATGSVAVLAQINPRKPGYAGVIEDFRSHFYTNGAGLNDSVSSIVNNSDVDLVIYYDGIANGYYGGDRVLIKRHSGLTNLDRVRVYWRNGTTYGDGLNFDNVASAARTGNNCTPKQCS